MNEPKWTPGPWAVSGVAQETGNISVGCPDQRIVIADVTNAASFGDMLSGAMRRGGGGFEQGDCHTQFANARLIAAAPDLADAVMPLAEMAEYLDAHNPDAPDNEETSISLGRLRAIHRALSKAKGPTT